MKLDTRSPLPMARPTAAGHPFHGLVKQGLTLPNGRVVPYSVLGISTRLQVPGWDQPEQYDPVTGYSWLPYAIYQRHKFFDGCYLYGRLINNCDWFVAFGVNDVWAVGINASGLTLRCLNRPGSKSFPLNWGAVADAFKPNTGWKWSLAAVSPSGNAVVLSFVKESVFAVALQIMPTGASINIVEHAATGARVGYATERRIDIAGFVFGSGVAPALCESVLLSSSVGDVPGTDRKRFTALMEWRIGMAKLGQYRMVTEGSDGTGYVVTDLQQIQAGLLQAPGFIWSDEPQFAMVGDGLVKVSRTTGLGDEVRYGVVDLVAGTGALWPLAATHVAVHPVTRQLVFDDAPICFA
ncbi:hypothetical protein [Chromobacterium haemolyticum]|uniref:hypothetical protein n=1 Tax=Chromobacterium haemolyticum TaxID=394935 RepID=UPI00307F58C2